MAEKKTKFVTADYAAELQALDKVCILELEADAAIAELEELVRQLTIRDISQEEGERWLHEILEPWVGRSHPAALESSDNVE